MSNLTGSVDVVREQERRARLQLLDGIREPSPQPIFGEPVKVELEDETSRRIKNTLGEISHVLLNDGKGFGISRSLPNAGNSGGGPRQIPSSHRSHPSSKRPPPLPNGVHKPSGPDKPLRPSSSSSSSSLYSSSRSGAEKRPSSSSHPKHPAISVSASSSSKGGVPHHNHHPDRSRPRDPPPRDKDHRRSVPAANSTSTTNAGVASSNISTSAAASSSLANGGGGKTQPSLLQNGSLPNGMVRQSRHQDQRSSDPTSRISQAKRTIPHLIILDKEEKHSDSHIELETILREMKQAVPPPLTAIQTPKAEDGGFSFPDNANEDLSFGKIEEQLIACDPVPVPSNESKTGVSSPRQPASSPYNLQEDLEMSDSDDDLVPEPKIPPNDYLKSPANNAMNSHPPLSTHSSSSESCDSDSDESSSESNDSDSSASSEASDVEAPSKPAPQMWGLSNFFDETRRNNSPAFMQMDNNTNSSTAVKEEPVHSVGTERDSFSLVDEDSVNGLIGKYSTHIRSPLPDLMDIGGAPVNIKTEILSPISSPVHSSQLPAPPVIRGPRTPPTPPFPIKDDDEDDEPQFGTTTATTIISTTAMTSSSKSPRDLIKASHAQNATKALSKSRSDVKEEKGPAQSDKSSRKQQRTAKSKAAVSSPRVKASPAANSDEPCASKETPDVVGFGKEKDETIPVPVSSSGPSESFASPRDAPSVKSRHKHSSSAPKKDKSLGEDPTKESSHKKSSSSKSAHATKTKHSSKPPKISESSEKPKTEPSGGDDSKKRSKSDSKDRKSGGSTKSPKSYSRIKTPKSSSKSKSKSSKHSSESKKPEVKKKSKKKFSIKNFLQSPPSCTQKDSERGVDEDLPLFSPSPERSPIPDVTESRRKASVSPARSSRSPSRSSSKSVERSRTSGKHGRTPRREGATREGSNSSSRKAPKSKPRDYHLDELPGHAAESPIPHSSSPAPTPSESAIPAKIMVSIPLDKLSRLPAGAHDSKKLPKPRSSSSSSSAARPSDDSSRDKSSSSSSKRDDSASRSKPSKRDDKSSKREDKVSKRDAAEKVSSQAKDYKDKPRTDLPSKSTSSSGNSGSSSAPKKEKSSKLPSDSSDSKSKASSSVNNKSSIKIVVDKTHCDESDAKVSKKRKSEDEEKLHVKKKKTSHTSEERSSSKKDQTSNQNDNLKLKPLERCDSASSLSSLCSQQSQQSSKSSKEKCKDSSKGAPESKKLKTCNSPLLSAKEIKQEKEEKPKIYIKKEPGLSPPPEKIKKSRERLPIECKDMTIHDRMWNNGLDPSSQYCQWEEPPCKADDPKAILTNQQLYDRDAASNWDHFASDMHKELKETANLNKHNNQTPIMPMDYFWTEGRKQKQLADKEKDPLLQALKYFEATVLFILTSQQREEYTKDPDSVYQFYKYTLKFSSVVRSSVQKLISQYHNTNPGSTEFKLLILCLKCQSLLHVKLYNLKIKEVKEQLKPVLDFFHHVLPSRNSSHPSPHRPRLSGSGNVPSPHSPTPSPAGSVNSVGSQSSGYSSSGTLAPASQTVSVPMSMLEMIYRQHTHWYSLHQGHDLWEQADMYMTRSNLREFFKEVADHSEPLTLQSTIKELVTYIQKGLSLVKKCSR